MAKEILTQERLKELLDYDPETGVFTWVVSKSARATVGAVAGYTDYRGCITIRIDGRLCRAHRAAWLWTHGVWPTAEIDHIDCDPSNNRLSNLRESTRALNMQNRRRAESGNKSGFLGVSWRNDRNKWVARIHINGKKIHLGHFGAAEEAYAEYLRAKHKYHEFNTLEHPGGGMREPRVYSSPYVGVCWRKDNKKWAAYITIDGKRVHLGFFHTEEEANATYLQAKG